MSEFGKKPDIMILNINEKFESFEIVGKSAKEQLEMLKTEVESVSRKIQIIMTLPRVFRDAITMEEKFSGQYVFTISEENAIKFGLVTKE